MSTDRYLVLMFSTLKKTCGDELPNNLVTGYPKQLHVLGQNLARSMKSYDMRSSTSLFSLAVFVVLSV